MKPIQDIRRQAQMRRDLEIELNKTVIRAVNDGLNPDQALAAVEAIWLQEVRLEKSRRQDERSYV